MWMQKGPGLAIQEALLFSFLLAGLPHDGYPFAGKGRTCETCGPNLRPAPSSSRRRLLREVLGKAPISHAWKRCSGSSETWRWPTLAVHMESGSGLCGLCISVIWATLRQDQSLSKNSRSVCTGNRSVQCVWLEERRCHTSIARGRTRQLESYVELRWAAQSLVDRHGHVGKGGLVVLCWCRDQNGHNCIATVAVPRHLGAEELAATCKFEVGLV